MLSIFAFYENLSSIIFSNFCPFHNSFLLYFYAEKKTPVLTENERFLIHILQV